MLQRWKFQTYRKMFMTDYHELLMPDSYQQERSSLFFHTILSHDRLFASIRVLHGDPLCPVLFNLSVVLG